MSSASLRALALAEPSSRNPRDRSRRRSVGHAAPRARLAAHMHRCRPRDARRLSDADFRRALGRGRAYRHAGFGPTMQVSGCPVVLEISPISGPVWLPCSAARKREPGVGLIPTLLNPVCARGALSRIRISRQLGLRKHEDTPGSSYAAFRRPLRATWFCIVASSC